MDQVQTSVISASDCYDYCVQKRNGLRTEICSSRVVEVKSEKIYVLIDFSDFL